MDLTGAPLLGVVVAVALAAASALVVAWPRLAGRGVLPVLGRVAALAGVQAVVVLALLVAANDQFDFYSSLSDLRGDDGALAVSTSGAAAGGTGGGAAATAAHPVHDAGVPVPGTGGRVERVPLPGAASGVTGGWALVLLPAGYDDPASAGRAYPVVEAFHGYPGTPRQWLDAMGLQAALDDAVSSGHLAPSIVVVPDLALPAGRDTECLDGPAGQPQLETWLTRDVPADVQASYRAQASPRAWATAGFSMGGWCAATAAMLHPDRYAAAISLGGYFTYSPGDYQPLVPGGPAARAHDLVALAGSASPPPVAVFAEAARTDPSSYPSTQALAAAARAPLAVTLAVQTSGGHRTQLWADELPAALAWLGTAAPGFAPAPAG